MSFLSSVAMLSFLRGASRVTDSCSAASSLLVIPTAEVAMCSVAAELRLAAGRQRYANALNETEWESSGSAALSVVRCLCSPHLRDIGNCVFFILSE